MFKHPGLTVEITTCPTSKTVAYNPAPVTAAALGAGRPSNIEIGICETRPRQFRSLSRLALSHSGSANLGGLCPLGTAVGCLAIGTTSLRLIASAAAGGGEARPFVRETRLSIMPAFRFRAINILLINFHLPRSTRHCAEPRQGCGGRVDHTA